MLMKLKMIWNIIRSRSVMYKMNMYNGRFGNNEDKGICYVEPQTIKSVLVNNSFHVDSD